MRTIICGSITFSQILAFSEASTELARVVIGADLAPLAVLIGMLAVLMVLGCFMDQVSMMMITVPLFLPVVEAIGYDTIAFGVLMLMVLEISLATPPFGLLLFVIRGAAPESTTMQEIIGSVAPVHRARARRRRPPHRLPRAHPVPPRPHRPLSLPSVAHLHGLIERWRHCLSSDQGQGEDRTSRPVRASRSVPVSHSTIQSPTSVCCPG